MKKIYLILIILFVATFGSPVFADTAAGSNSATGQFEFQPIVPIPLPGGGTVNNCTSLGDYINAAFQLAITVAVVLAVVMMILNGFQYMTAEAVGNKKQALDGIRSAISGLVIILSCTLILNIIDPNITKITLFNQSGLPGCSTSVNGISLTAPSDITAPTINISADGTDTWCYTDTSGGTVCASSVSDCQSLYGDFPPGTGQSCSIKITTASPTQNVQDSYAWVAQFTAPGSQTGQTTQKILRGGPFSTQSACYTSARDSVPSGYTLSDPPGYTCSCDKTVAAQGSACSQ